MHLSVSCSLVERGQRAHGAWGTFLVMRGVFCSAKRSSDMTHVCLSVSVWTASFCTAVILTSQSVWSIIKRKKYQNECSVAMMPDLFLFTSVRVSQKTFAGEKKNVDVRRFVSVKSVTMWCAQLRWLWIDYQMGGVMWLFHLLKCCRHVQWVLGNLCMYFNIIENFLFMNDILSENLSLEEPFLMPNPPTWNNAVVNLED